MPKTALATTQKQITAMRAVAGNLSASPLVKRAWIGEWSRTGVFGLVVKPSNPTDEHITTRVRALIYSHLPKGAKIKKVVQPVPVMGYDFLTNRQNVIGFAKPYWHVEIDYPPTASHAQTSTKAQPKLADMFPALQ
jgi:hypothetical protein